MTDKKYKVLINNEVVAKALECCGDADCDNCPYSGDDLLRPCNDNLVKDTIDLINRQKAEIERLNNTIYTFEKHFEFVKAEVVKKFAERLHNLIHSDWQKIHQQIDNLAQELVGEQRKEDEGK